MNTEKYLELVNKVEQDRFALMGGKRQDYATEDVLSNFKRMSEVCRLLDIDPRRSPADNARYLMMLKVDRWCNLARKGTPPVNESVRDTIHDLHNYIDLAYACEVDRCE